jgi:hypothetical protein
MTPNKKRVPTPVRLALAIAVGAAGLAFTPARAEAFPQECSTWKAANEGFARCWSGTGQFRAEVRCDGWFSDHTRYGAWRVLPDITASKGRCEPGDSVVWVKATDRPDLIDAHGSGPDRSVGTQRGGAGWGGRDERLGSGGGPCPGRGDDQPLDAAGPRRHRP